MENSKPAQNIQDSFLNTARKERLSITIYLLSGVKLTGRIRSFDKYSVVLEANGQEQLIFKHAISTVVMGRTGPHVAHLAHPEAKAVGTPGSAPSSSSGADRSLGGKRLGHRRVRRSRLAQFSSQEDPRSCVGSPTCASRAPRLNVKIKTKTPRNARFWSGLMCALADEVLEAQLPRRRRRLGMQRLLPLPRT